MINAQQPIERYIFESKQLIADHPPVLEHPNKRAVYKVACPPGAKHTGHISYTRWATLDLPQSFNPQKAVEHLQTREDVYDYAPAFDSPNTMDWHVNFADPKLFAFYGSGLFAQDEMQVAEHPILGALREALTARRIFGDTNPTPILISGVERRCRVAIDPNISADRPVGLYGNNFSAATEDVISRSTVPIEPPTITNLIAIAAQRGSGGLAYTTEEIQEVLVRAYSGFRSAVSQSPDGSTAVHTGFWGCGAFGGNHTLMAMCQIIASEMAGVKQLIFYTVDEHGSTQLDKAVSQINSFGKSILDTNALLTRIRAMDFKWGRTNWT